MAVSKQITVTLNVKKTKYMLIGSQFKLSQINSDFTVKVNNTLLVVRWLKAQIYTERTKAPNFAWL